MKQTGFSLVELIVMISILAFLSSVTLAAIMHFRSQGRDSVRVMNVTQMQTALRAYYRDQRIYPPSLTMGQSLASGTIVYMDKLPEYPKPVDGDCPSNSTYTYTQTDNGQSYQLTFCLSDQTADLSGGINLATPAGIVAQ